MIECPNCGERAPKCCLICFECGAALHPPKKGRLWPPILILIILFATGLGVFSATKGMFTPTADSSTPWFSIDNGTVYFDPELYSGSPELEVPSIINGQTVTALGAGSFHDCDGLTTVFLPDTLTTIDSQAFRDCDSLRGVKLPESVTSIGDGAFSDCVALEALYIPAATTTIGAGAFDGCIKLKHIFYAGPYDRWIALYTGKIAENTWIYSADGADLHGAKKP